MEKVAIVTLVTNQEWAKLAEITLPSQREYARRLGAEFIVLDKCVYPHPHYDKWQIFGLLEDYDRVIYMDADIVVRPDCPDLFVMVPPEYFAGENELLSFPGQAQHLARFLSLMGMPPIPCPYYINGGLLVASKAHRKVFRPPERILMDIPWPEQNHFNARLIGERVPVATLDRSFNDRHREPGYLRRSYILHYSVTPLQQRIEAAQRDLAEWRTLSRRG